MKPLQIKTANKQLHIHWDDGAEWAFSFTDLRDHCPCAGCQGETILLKTYKPTEAPKTPDSYKLTGIVPVGGYAVTLHWKDGHDSGIYSWEFLSKLHEKLQAADGTLEG